VLKRRFGPAEDSEMWNRVKIEPRAIFQGGQTPQGTEIAEFKGAFQGHCPLLPRVVYYSLMYVLPATRKYFNLVLQKPLPLSRIKLSTMMMTTALRHT
jgi:hypothetical protein